MANLLQAFVFFLLFFLFNPPLLFPSGAFPISDPSKPLIGVKQIYKVAGKETLIDLARDYDLGYNEIVAANSAIDPWVPDLGASIVIPSKWLLPEMWEQGLIVNLAEMRLYFFFMVNNKQYVQTFPLGIGKKGFGTPTGLFKVTAKVEDPVWHVPKVIKKQRPHLPDFVPPGPENPLGKYWINLSVNGYGIHGTNRPFGIGRRVSHGCMRLYPEDIEVLFKFVKPGIKVKIMDDPVKAGIYSGRVYIEVHNNSKTVQQLMKLAVKKLSEKNLLRKVDSKLLLLELKNATGLPTIISK